MEERAPVLELNGKIYDISGASEEAIALINDMVTIQNELNRIKIQFDIATIAKNAVVASLSKRVEEGTSGLVELEGKTENKTEQEEN